MKYLRMLGSLIRAEGPTPTENMNKNKPPQKLFSSSLSNSEKKAVMKYFLMQTPFEVSSFISFCEKPLILSPFAHFYSH